MDKAGQLLKSIGAVIKEKWLSSTLTYIFIVAYVTVFPMLFGAENSIVGIIFSIMMSASMVRDLTATPIKHLCIQSFVLFMMAISACAVTSLPPAVSLPINFIMILVLLYSFTYEYVSHLYFPYILSYLFLLFISPITFEQLPKRLLSVFVGVVGIIIYQLVKGRKRISETAHDALITMIDKADFCIGCMFSGEGVPQSPKELRGDLCKLSKIVYDRRRKTLSISDAAFAMVDAGRGMENLILLLYQIEGIITPERAVMLRQASKELKKCKAFMLGDADTIEPLNRADFGKESAEADKIYQCLCYVREHMLKMTLPKKRVSYHKTLLSFSVRLKAALNISPVRLTYALRVAALLALGTFAVQTLHLPHGKWLLFTIASVSLPYADDVPGKAKKRFIATVCGCAASFILFSLIPSSTGRTAIMMLSGYVSYYFSEYTGTFSCSTVGALGSAVAAGSFGFAQVGYMTLVRIGYIIVGIGIAMLANCVLFPFSRKLATKQLWEKYIKTTDLLSLVCREDNLDVQFYYNLVIQAHLQEDKLYNNAKDLNWEGAQEEMMKCQESVRAAHRRPLAG